MLNPFDILTIYSFLESAGGPDAVTVAGGIIVGMLSTAVPTVKDLILGEAAGAAHGIIKDKIVAFRDMRRLPKLALEAQNMHFVVELMTVAVRASPKISCDYLLQSRGKDDEEEILAFFDRLKELIVASEVDRFVPEDDQDWNNEDDLRALLTLRMEEDSFLGLEKYRDMRTFACNDVPNQARNTFWKMLGEGDNVICNKAWRQFQVMLLHQISTDVGNINAVTNHVALLVTQAQTELTQMLARIEAQNDLERDAWGTEDLKHAIESSTATITVYLDNSLKIQTDEILVGISTAGSESIEGLHVRLDRWQRDVLTIVPALHHNLAAFHWDASAIAGSVKVFSSSTANSLYDELANTPEGDRTITWIVGPKGAGKKSLAFYLGDHLARHGPLLDISDPNQWPTVKDLLDGAGVTERVLVGANLRVTDRTTASAVVRNIRNLWGLAQGGCHILLTSNVDSAAFGQFAEESQEIQVDRLQIIPMGPRYYSSAEKSTIFLNMAGRIAKSGDPALLDLARRFTNYPVGDVDLRVPILTFLARLPSLLPADLEQTCQELSAHVTTGEPLGTSTGSLTHSRAALEHWFLDTLDAASRFFVLTFAMHAGQNASDIWNLYKQNLATIKMNLDPTLPLQPLAVLAERTKQYILYERSEYMERNRLSLDTSVELPELIEILVRDYWPYIEHILASYRKLDPVDTGISAKPKVPAAGALTKIDDEASPSPWWNALWESREEKNSLYRAHAKAIAFFFGHAATNLSWLRYSEYGTLLSVIEGWAGEKSQDSRTESANALALSVEDPRTETIAITAIAELAKSSNSNAAWTAARAAGNAANFFAIEQQFDRMQLPLNLLAKLARSPAAYVVRQVAWGIMRTSGQTGVQPIASHLKVIAGRDGLTPLQEYLVASKGKRDKYPQNFALAQLFAAMAFNEAARKSRSDAKDALAEASAYAEIGRSGNEKRFAALVLLTATRLPDDRITQLRRLTETDVSAVLDALSLLQKIKPVIDDFSDGGKIRPYADSAGRRFADQATKSAVGTIARLCEPEEHLQIMAKRVVLFMDSAVASATEKAEVLWSVLGSDLFTRDRLRNTVVVYQQNLVDIRERRDKLRKELEDAKAEVERLENRLSGLFAQTKVAQERERRNGSRTRWAFISCLIFLGLAAVITMLFTPSILEAGISGFWDWLSAPWTVAKGTITGFVIVSAGLLVLSGYYYSQYHTRRGERIRMDKKIEMTNKELESARVSRDETDNNLSQADASYYELIGVA